MLSQLSRIDMWYTEFTSVAIVGVISKAENYLEACRSDPLRI